MIGNGLRGASSTYGPGYGKKGGIGKIPQDVSNNFQGKSMKQELTYPHIDIDESKFVYYTCSRSVCWIGLQCWSSSKTHWFWKKKQKLKIWLFFQKFKK